MATAVSGYDPVEFLLIDHSQGDDACRETKNMTQLQEFTEKLFHGTAFAPSQRT
jgi:hypothetical protein